MIGRVLIVAGSDSGGGAGIQADIKTVTLLGGYAATAITALTAQNTRGVADVLPIPPAFVARQMEVVLNLREIAHIHRQELAEIVTEFVEEQNIPARILPLGEIAKLQIRITL